MKAKKIENDLILYFNNDEALVFFNWLSQLNQEGKKVFESQSEQRILWDIESVLEEILPEIFQNDYKELVKKAQLKLKDSE